jgi:hypothetical protein
MWGAAHVRLVEPARAARRPRHLDRAARPGAAHRPHRRRQVHHAAPLRRRNRAEPHPHHRLRLPADHAHRLSAFALAQARSPHARPHSADLFDAARAHLSSYEQEKGPHPILLIDNGEGLSVPILDVIRRLTCYELDGEDRFSLLLCGTDELLVTLRDASLASLRSRIGYAHTLRPFTLEDVRNYVQFHLQRAEVDPKLFTDDAIKRLFQASHGRPRSINQLATQALIHAVVLGRESIDGDFMNHAIASHPLYQAQAQATP